MGPLANSIHGSIGGSNFYKHGAWQVVRGKAQPRQSTSYLRGKALSCHSQAVADAKLRYRSTTQTRIDNAAALLTLNRYGNAYKLTGFQLLVNMNFMALYYHGVLANIYANTVGMMPALVMTVDIWNLPDYIVINYEDAPPPNPLLAFDWAYPISWENAPKPSKFPYHATHPVGLAGQWKIPQGTNPRISGRTTLWWRARLIRSFGEYSPQWSGFVRKWNWQ